MIALALFTVAGPWLWRVDPVGAGSRPDQPSARVAREGPRSSSRSRLGPASRSSPCPRKERRCRARCGSPSPRRRRRCGSCGSRRTTRPRYHVYRNIYDPEPDRALGLPLAEILDPRQVSVEDRFDLEARRYWYSVVAVDRNGVESEEYAGLVVDARARRQRRRRPRTAAGSRRGATVRIGDELTVPYHPLGTDYLGRDMLARLMYGARVSLFIGVVAPFLFVAFGVLYGSAAGFVGRTRRPGAHALRRFRRGAAVPAVHDPVQDRLRHRPRRERRLPDARGARGALLAVDGAARARPDPADPKRRLHRRVAAARAPRPATSCCGT